VTTLKSMVPRKRARYSAWFFINGRATPNERQKKAIEYIKKKGSVSNKEYRNIFKISAATAKRELQDLVKKKICKTRGAGPSLKYIIG